MKKQFINLVLIPVSFCIALLGTIFFKISPFSFLLFLAFTSEHLYKWMLSVKKKYSDFRIFYTEQYFKLLYLAFLFLIYILNAITWKYSNFWSLFAYAANFIILRIIGSSGIDQLNQTHGRVSNAISLSTDQLNQTHGRVSNAISLSTDQSNKNLSGVSKPISSTFEIWEENKNSLSEILEDIDDLDIKNFIKTRLNYSSFLRTSKAAALIKEAREVSGEDYKKIILKIKELL